MSVLWRGVDHCGGLRGLLCSVGRADFRSDPQPAIAETRRRRPTEKPPFPVGPGGGGQSVRRGDARRESQCGHDGATPATTIVLDRHDTPRCPLGRAGKRANTITLASTVRRPSRRAPRGSNARRSSAGPVAHRSAARGRATVFVDEQGGSARGEHRFECPAGTTRSRSIGRAGPDASPRAVRGGDRPLNSRRPAFSVSHSYSGREE